MRAQEDAVLSERIPAIPAKSKCTYGRPRIHAELRSQKTVVGLKRVRRLMLASGLQGASRRRARRTTLRGRERHSIPDLVDRNFKANEPTQLWVTDITYIPTWNGFVFLAVVVDAFSRKLVGWSMANHLRTSLVPDALDIAIGQRKPSGGGIHHIDHIYQYTSFVFGQRCREAHVRPSMIPITTCPPKRINSTVKNSEKVCQRR
jgi:putative transposase